MRALIARSHESGKDKAAHRARAVQLFRSLVERKIVEIVPPAARSAPWAKLRVNVELQENFSLDQSLSLFLLDALPLLDPESPEHALDVLTLVESILENPELVLRKQLDMLKTERMAELKAQGVEFDQRIQELEAMEYPKPLREFVYATFNAFAEKHPWVGGENIRPKSIAREMLEGYYTFSGYVKRYGLERSEGLLLRHLHGVYKVLANTIPESAKTEAVREMEVFFGDLVRRIDSSLLDEWERMRDPAYVAGDRGEPKPPGAEEAERAAARDVTADHAAFSAAIRARALSFLSSLARLDYEGALEALSEGAPETPSPARDAASPGADARSPWTADTLRKALEAYRADHGMYRLDPEGRAARHTRVDENAGDGLWRVTQALQDGEGRNDWAVTFGVDLTVSRMAGAPILRLDGFGPE
jgi:hypothetical protein